MMTEFERGPDYSVINKIARQKASEDTTEFERGPDNIQESHDVSDSMKGAASSAAKTAARGGSAGDVASSALMASGNPYAMAAGLGLSVLSGISERKAQERQAEYQNKVGALNNLSQMAMRLKRL